MEPETIGGIVAGSLLATGLITHAYSVHKKMKRLDKEHEEEVRAKSEELNKIIDASINIAPPLRGPYFFSELCKLPYVKFVPDPEFDPEYTRSVVEFTGNQFNIVREDLSKNYFI